MQKFWNKLKNIGPGALVAAAFIGPGTVNSCSASGASYGTTLLWALLFSTISVIIMQEMSARLGIVRQIGLGEALRTKFTGKVARVLLAILVIGAVFIGNVAYETGNITGSRQGIVTVFTAWDGNPTALLWIAIAIGVIAFGMLFTGNYKLVQNILTGLVVLMGVLFLVCAIAIGPDWGAVIKGLFVPIVPQKEKAWMTVAALMGTTVVPYNIYLHASSAAKKWHNPKEDLSTSRLDTIISIGLGGVISMAIVVCASGAAYGTDVSSGAAMAKSLEPLLGGWAQWCFGIGLFAAGITSTITAPLAAAFASSGILGWGEDMKKLRFKAFWFVVLAFGVVASCTLGASPQEIILFAQAANAILLPITGVLLLIVCNDKKLMGDYKNKWWHNVLALIVIGVFLFIAARNMTAFVGSMQSLFIK